MPIIAGTSKACIDSGVLDDAHTISVISRKTKDVDMLHENRNKTPTVIAYSIRRQSNKPQK